MNAKNIVKSLRVYSTNVLDIERMVVHRRARMFRSESLSRTQRLLTLQDSENSSPHPLMNLKP